MNKFIFGLLFTLMVLSPNVSAAKTAREHVGILLRGGLTALGVAPLVKGGKVLVKAYKIGVPAKWIETVGDIEEGRQRIKDVQEKMKDPTGVGFLVWGAATTVDIGATILETALPPVRIGHAVLDVSYSYHRNWQDDWIKDLKKEPNPPYRERSYPPKLPNPKDPGKDHPDDYKGVLEAPFVTPPANDIEMLLQEYDELSLSYLAFEVGLSINDPVCDYEMGKFVQKLKTTNPDYDKHLEEVKQKSEEAYQAAYEVQKKVCLLYYGTITETTEFPHFKIQEEVTNFLNSLTPQQREEVLALQKIYFDKMKIAVDAQKQIYEDIRNTVDVGIMYHGFPDDIVNLLNSLEVSNATFWDDDEDLSKYKTIIMPSGSSFGMDTSEIFKWQLRQYVKNGGVLISFAQQQGYEFSCLPGGEVKGYGWAEDQSCWTNAAYVDTYKPCFAGQNSANLDVNVDGYFTQWPASATVLLRRIKNNMPCMISYPYDKGYVIASTLFSDWGYGHNQTSKAEITLIRDLISWAKDINKEIPEVKPDETIKLDVSVVNNTDKVANKAILTLIDPDRNIIATQTITTIIPPHSTIKTTHSPLLPQNSKHGIWWVGYELQDNANNTIQPQTEGERFAVSKHLTGSTKLDGYKIWAISDDQAAVDSNVVYTVFVRNDTNENFNGNIGVGVHEQGGRYWANVGVIPYITLPAHSQRSFVFERNVNFSTATYFGLFPLSANYETYFLKGAVTTCEKGVWVIKPSVDIHTMTNKKQFVKGDDVSIGLNFTNKELFNYEFSVISSCNLKQ